MRKSIIAILIAAAACAPTGITLSPMPAPRPLLSERIEQPCVRPQRWIAKGDMGEARMRRESSGEYEHAVYEQGPDCEYITRKALGEDLHARISIYMKERRMVVVPERAMRMLEKEPTYCRPRPYEFIHALMPHEHERASDGLSAFRYHWDDGRETGFNPAGVRDLDTSRMDPCPDADDYFAPAPAQQDDRSRRLSDPEDSQTPPQRIDDLVREIDDLHERVDSLMRMPQTLERESQPPVLPDSTLAIRLGEDLYLFPEAQLVCMQAEQRYCIRLEDVIGR